MIKKWEGETKGRKYLSKNTTQKTIWKEEKKQIL